MRDCANCAGESQQLIRHKLRAFAVPCFCETTLRQGDAILSGKAIDGIQHLLAQFETPDAIHGRVSAVNSVFIGASNEPGEFESGITAGWFGLVPTILIGGIATLAVTGAWAFGFPVLSKMDRFPHTAKEAQKK
jgi:hypothetical protein